MLRFAPSPNGPLHIGHALSALANERMAIALDRPMTVRIEDIDTGRSRETFVAAIFNDLGRLGVDWEPPARRQSEHFQHYREAIERLSARGLVTPSFASRREIAAALGEGRLPRAPDCSARYLGDAHILGSQEAARRRAAAEPVAWRLSMARALKALDGQRLRAPVVDDLGRPLAWRTLDPAPWGDIVLARKDTPTSYHVSVVVDDAIQGITHVVRGRDLEGQTAIHRLLQALLDLPVPAYHHHALVLARDGRKLSKSDGAASLSALFAAGASAREIRARLAPFLPSHAKDREP